MEDRFGPSAWAGPNLSSITLQYYIHELMFGLPFGRGPNIHSCILLVKIDWLGPLGPPTNLTLTNNMNLHYPGHTARQASKKGEQCVQDEGSCIIGKELDGCLVSGSAKRFAPRPTNQMLNQK